jgi:transcriptional regulator with XRE-family HTH domain
MLVSGPQLRAARAAAALTREELAAAAGLGTMTISRLEAEGGRLRSSLVTLDALRRALEAAGVRLVEHDGMPGVCVARDIPRRG